MSRNGSLITNFVLILAIVVVEIATDIYIPTLSYLTEFFQTTEEAVNSSLSASLLGFSLSGPIFGPLSDAYGCKKLIILELLLFTDDFSSGHTRNRAEPKRFSDLISCE